MQQCKTQYWMGYVIDYFRLRPQVQNLEVFCKFVSMTVKNHFHVKCIHTAENIYNVKH